MNWDGCLGGAISDKSLTKKACDKMLIAHHCLEDIDARFPEKGTEFKKKYYEYYVRMYISSITSLSLVKDKECLKKINNSIKEHEAVFSYADKCVSRNLKILYILKLLSGVKFTKMIILKRYQV